MIRREVVLGPAPCITCGAWVEWLGVGLWVALESHEPHECQPYLEARPWGPSAAALIELAAPWRGARPAEEALASEPAWLTVRLVVGLMLVAVFFALALVRWQAGLL